MVWGKRRVIFETVYHSHQLILMVVIVLYIEVGGVKVINTTQLCGNIFITIYWCILLRMHFKYVQLLKQGVCMSATCSLHRGLCCTVYDVLC